MKFETRTVATITLKICVLISEEDSFSNAKESAKRAVDIWIRNALNDAIAETKWPYPECRIKSITVDSLKAEWKQNGDDIDAAKSNGRSPGP